MTSVLLVIPVYNEEEVLENNVIKILKQFKNKWEKFEIIIANNASTDRTLEIAKRLSKSFENVRYIHLDKKGRGLALKKAWSESNSDIIAYMDVDLSTDLKHFPELIDGIVKKNYDLCIGSRLLKESYVINRSLIREIFSRLYNVLIRILFHTSFHDAQCGFKAISRNTVKNILPLVKDNGWFFDTELLIITEKLGYKIKEIPVKWTDDPTSTVKVLKTGWSDINGLIRLRITMPWKFKYKK